MANHILQEFSEKLTIEQIENKLFYLGDGFPKEAVQAAIAQQSAITPKLISCLNKAIEDKSSLEENAVGHLFAVFLLSQFQEKTAFESMIRLARLPEDDIDLLIGDSITEDLHRFIASTYNGDLLAIKRLIEDIEINQWSRKAALKSLVILANEGQVDVDETIGYMKNLFTHPSFSDDNGEITDLVTVCCDFLPQPFYDQIQQAFQDERVDTFVIDMTDIKRRLSHDKPKYIADYYTYITDTIAEMEHWHCFRDSNKNDISSSPKWLESLPASIIQTHTVRDTLKIGRNEHCPCSSGKKYKKCCLNNI